MGVAVVRAMVWNGVGGPATASMLSAILAKLSSASDSWPTSAERMLPGRAESRRDLTMESSTCSPTSVKRRRMSVTSCVGRRSPSSTAASASSMRWWRLARSISVTADFSAS